jgi:LemA protein
MDVQLKRRHDLIPNLVEVVKGYASHERGTLEEVTALRVGLEDADLKAREAGERAITNGLKRLFAVAEAYPDLKASQDFLDLQKNLTDVEDQIQMARRYYNGAVRIYNICVESFPTNVVAKLGGFRAAEFFELETATEREAPKVEFPS